MEVLLLTFLFIASFIGAVLLFLKGRYVLGTILSIVFILVSVLGPLLYAKKNNTMVDVTYTFPAEIYDIETVIESTENVKINGTDSVRTLKHDTTYVVHGVVPYYHQDDGKKIVKIDE